MSVATGGSEAAAAGGGGGGGRVFFQSPRGGGSGREDAVSAAAVQVQQRRHQQGKVTVKYDRKELRKRLVLEEWIVEQLGQLYGCQVRGGGAGCPARLPQSPRPPRAPGPPAAASGRRPRRGAPSRRGAPRGRLRQRGEEGRKGSRGGGRRRSASCTALPPPAAAVGAAGGLRWADGKKEGREREKCERRYGRTYCIEVVNVNAVFQFSSVWSVCTGGLSRLFRGIITVVSKGALSKLRWKCSSTPQGILFPPALSPLL